MTDAADSEQNQKRDAARRLLEALPLPDGMSHTLQLPKPLVLPPLPTPPIAADADEEEEENMTPPAVASLVEDDKEEEEEEEDMTPPTQQEAQPAFDVAATEAITTTKPLTKRQTRKLEQQHRIARGGTRPALAENAPQKLSRREREKRLKELQAEEQKQRVTIHEEEEKKKVHETPEAAKRAQKNAKKKARLLAKKQALAALDVAEDDDFTPPEIGQVLMQLDTEERQRKADVADSSSSSSRETKNAPNPRALELQRLLEKKKQAFGFRRTQRSILKRQLASDDATTEGLNQGDMLKEAERLRKNPKAMLKKLGIEDPEVAAYMEQMIRRGKFDQIMKDFKGAS